MPGTPGQRCAGCRRQWTACRGRRPGCPRRPRATTSGASAAVPPGTAPAGSGSPRRRNPDNRHWHQLVGHGPRSRWISRPGSAGHRRPGEQLVRSRSGLTSAKAACRLHSTLATFRIAMLTSSMSCGHAELSCSPNGLVLRLEQERTERARTTGTSRNWCAKGQKHLHGKSPPS